jgi:hypothetical protein
VTFGNTYPSVASSNYLSWRINTPSCNIYLFSSTKAPNPAAAPIGALRPWRGTSPLLDMRFAMLFQPD